MLGGLGAEGVPITLVVTAIAIVIVTYILPSVQFKTRPITSRKW